VVYKIIYSSEVIEMAMSDNAKGRMLVILFLLGLPMLYLGPVIINAITDLATRFFG